MDAHGTKLALAKMGVDGLGRSRRNQPPRGYISGSFWKAGRFGKRAYCDRGLAVH